MTFDEARALFPVLEHAAYLNAGTFGPLARPTAEAIAAQLRRDLEQGRSGRPYIEEMQAARATLRELIADLLGTTTGHVALTYSTTDACNIVLSGLGLRPDDEIVTTDAEHFGLVGPVFASGARVRVAQAQGRGPEEVLEAIVAEVTPRTRLLAVSHVLWTTGVALDLHALKQRTDLPVLVDGAQSAGAIAVDLGGLDYYTVSGQKWLCGPDTTGGLYLADIDTLRVARPGMFAQESFEPGGRYVPRPGAQRFDSGWLSIASLKGLATAMDLAPEWRFAHIQEIAATCREALADRVQVVTPPNQAGLVAFQPKGDAEALVAHLLEQGIVVRNIPGTPFVRASCGWWTSDEDVERLAAAL